MELCLPVGNPHTMETAIPSWLVLLYARISREDQLEVWGLQAIVKTQGPLNTINHNFG